MSKIIGNTTATPNPRSDWAQTDSTKADYIKNKPIVLTENDVIGLIEEHTETGGVAQVQSDWNQTDDTQVDFIKNKPALPTDIANLNATITELNYMSGVTDSVQDQLDAKTQVQIINEDVTEILSTLKIHKVTQEQYDQAFANGTLEDNALYLTYGDETDLSGYATIEQLNAKADATHTHNDIYYTKTEIENNVSTINTSISNSLIEAKFYSDANFATANTYTDNAVAQKSQVQIIIWEADD